MLEDILPEKVSTARFATQSHSVVTSGQGAHVRYDAYSARVCDVCAKLCSYDVNVSAQFVRNMSQKRQVNTARFNTQSNRLVMSGQEPLVCYDMYSFEASGGAC